MQKEILDFLKESYDYDDGYTKQCLHSIMENKSETNRLIYKTIFTNKYIKLIKKNKQKNASVLVISKTKGNIDAMDNIKSIDDFIKRVKAFNTIPTDTWCSVMSGVLAKLRRFKKEFQTMFSINANLFKSLYISVVYSIYEECSYMLNKSIAHIPEDDKYELFSTKKVCDGLTFKALKNFYATEDSDLKVLFTEASKGSLFILREESEDIEDGNTYLEYINETVTLPTRIILTINNLILYVIREPIVLLFKAKYSVVDYVENIKLFLEYNTTENKDLSVKVKNRQKFILDTLNKASRILGLERQTNEKLVEKETAKKKSKKKKYNEVVDEIPDQTTFIF